MSRVGKVFKRRGGKYPGVWICIAVNPGDNCVCLGLDHEGNIVSATNYAGHYVDRQKALDFVNIEEMRFENTSYDQDAGD